MTTLAIAATLSAAPAPVAAPAGGAGGGGAFTLLILALPILLIVFMVFSQRRRQRQMQQMQASLNVGDDVITTTGLHGRISGVGDQVLYLEISPGTVVTWDRRGVLARPAVVPGAGVVPPAADAAEPADSLPSEPPTTPPVGGPTTTDSGLDDDDPRSSGSTRGE